MKSVFRTHKFFLTGRLFFVIAVLANAPLLSAQESSPVDAPVGTVFRWLNFVLVFGTFALVIAKFGGPYFRKRAQEISRSIHEAGETHAVAERELNQAQQKLSSISVEIQELRRAATRDSATEAERIRAFARAEAEKIGQAARAEIEAAERAGRQELRAIAARLATERAALLIRKQMNAAGEAALFQAFVGELERTAS